MNLWHFLIDKYWLLRVMLPATEIRAECGHWTKRFLIIQLPNGEKVFRDTGSEVPLYCHNCIAVSVIQCAWCQGYILPGSEISLLQPVSGFKVPDYAIRYTTTDHILFLVGCWRHCVANPRGQAYWHYPGVVRFK